MKARLTAGLATGAVGALVVLQVGGTAEVVLWEMVLMAAVIAVGWGLWPGSEPVGWLFASSRPGERRRSLALAEIDVELKGATDPQLGAAGPLKRRLVRLLASRGEHDSFHEARTVSGEAAWLALHNDSDTMRPVDIGRIVEGLERT